jgi:RHS repeat-associated protein
MPQARYAYDPFGRRIQKRLVSAQGQETLRRYVYDREDILFELDGSNTVLTQFLHGPGIDEPLTLVRNGETYRYHADALGSIIVITDRNNTIVQRYSYDAYGNLSASNPDFRQPYAYTGREYDEESGLYYYRARYYDPGVGRFLTRDSAGLRSGLHRYAYVSNNPVQFIDPTGHSAWEPVLEWALKTVLRNVLTYSAKQIAGDPMERGSEHERKALEEQYEEQYWSCIEGCRGGGNMSCLINQDPSAWQETWEQQYLCEQACKEQWDANSAAGRSYYP